MGFNSKNPTGSTRWVRIEEVPGRVSECVWERERTAGCLQVCRLARRRCEFPSLQVCKREEEYVTSAAENWCRCREKVKESVGRVFFLGGGGSELQWHEAGKRSTVCVLAVTPWPEEWGAKRSRQQHEQLKGCQCDTRGGDECRREWKQVPQRRRSTQSAETTEWRHYLQNQQPP